MAKQVRPRITQEEYNFLLNSRNTNKTLRPHISEEEYELILETRKEDERNVLVIGDLHTPFDLNEYFQFCVEQYKRWNCNQAIFIGDVIDNHYSSYHETDPDGQSAGDELDYSIKRLRRWYEQFPNSTVIIGNHDRMVYRKAFTGGVPKRWIKGYSDVLETPTWKFVEEYEQDGVLYIHGEGGTARTKMKHESTSVVSGHTHTQQYIEFSVNPTQRIFAVQTGCGVNRKSYGMAYAKHFKKPIIGCAVILENGKTPHVIAMDI